MGKTEANARITIPTGNPKAPSTGALYSRNSTRTANTIIMARKVMNSYILLVGIKPLRYQRLKKNNRWQTKPAKVKRKAA
ncbi:hypothetical protein D3C72_2409650 [compost metagenome]